MNIKVDSIPDLLTLKPKGWFQIEPLDHGFIITVNRPGCPIDCIPCRDPAECNRLRLPLSDEGLAGFIEGRVL